MTYSWHRTCLWTSFMLNSSGWMSKTGSISVLRMQSASSLTFSMFTWQTWMVHWSHPCITSQLQSRMFYRTHRIIRVTFMSIFRTRLCYVLLDSVHTSKSSIKNDWQSRRFFWSMAIHRASFNVTSSDSFDWIKRWAYGRNWMLWNMRSYIRSYSICKHDAKRIEMWSQSTSQGIRRSWLYHIHSNLGHWWISNVNFDSYGRNTTCTRDPWWRTYTCYWHHCPIHRWMIHSCIRNLLDLCFGKWNPSLHRSFISHTSFRFIRTQRISSNIMPARKTSCPQKRPVKRLLDGVVVGRVSRSTPDDALDLTREQQEGQGASGHASTTSKLDVEEKKMDQKTPSPDPSLSLPVARRHSPQASPTLQANAVNSGLLLTYPWWETMILYYLTGSSGSHWK